jgi:hypothetical protein
VLTFGEAAINLTDAGLLPNLCIGFGSAMLRSRASSAFNAELKDFIAPIRVSIARSPDPTTAHANKSALGAKVDDVSVLGGENPLNLPSPPGTDPSVQTSQTGPNSGPNTATAEQLNVVVPADGSVLTADLIRATSASTVGAMGAAHTSVAEAVDVNILDGVVTADVVRGAAQTTATNLASSFSAASSTFKNLRVNGGPPQNDVAPNSRVGLPALSFGEGSYVGLYELGPDPTLKTGTTSQPPVGQVGTFAADLTVTMIRVHITDDNGSLLPGGNPAEIIVSKAIAHSDFRGIRCTNREVSGHAFMVFEDTDPSLAPALVGWVAIPRSGGAQHQHLEAIDLSPAVAAEASDSDSTGDVGGDRSEATSYAQVADVCVLPTPTGCTISATVLRAASHSVANATSRSSDDADTQVVATIQGNSVLAQTPNTKIDLEGLGYVILNEQFCDQGASLAGGCAIGNHAGLTVRALHVVITVPDNPFGLQAGVEIIVCEAHSDATFLS